MADCVVTSANNTTIIVDPTSASTTTTPTSATTSLVEIEDCDRTPSLDNDGSTTTVDINPMDPPARKETVIVTTETVTHVLTYGKTCKFFVYH